MHIYLFEISKMIEVKLYIKDDLHCKACVIHPEYSHQICKEGFSEILQLLVFYESSSKEKVALTSAEPFLHFQNRDTNDECVKMCINYFRG